MQIWFKRYYNLVPCCSMWKDGQTDGWTGGQADKQKDMMDLIVA